MAVPIRFADGVQAELDDAAARVEADNEGMGLELVAAVRGAIARIAERPHTDFAIPNESATFGYALHIIGCSA